MMAMVNDICNYTRLHYCSAQDIPLVGVHMGNNIYYSQYFDHDLGKFVPSQCVECQGMTLEQHLVPTTTEMCPEINDQILHVYNCLTRKFEQYSLNRASGGLVQVNYPNLKKNKPASPEGVFKFPKTDKYPEFILQRTPQSTIGKMRYSEKLKQFCPIPPVYVNTLMMQEKMRSDYKPVYPNAAQKYTMDMCPHTTHLGLKERIYVGLFHKDKPLRFFFNPDTNEFFQMNCPFCPGPMTESKLEGIYSKYHEKSGKTVIWCWNKCRYQVEQYIFNKETMGFEQVLYPDLQFTNDYRENELVLSTVQKLENGVQKTIVIMKMEDGALVKYMEGVGELPPVPVQFIGEIVRSGAPVPLTHRSPLALTAVSSVSFAQGLNQTVPLTAAQQQQQKEQEQEKRFNEMMAGLPPPLYIGVDGLNNLANLIKIKNGPGVDQSTRDEQTKQQVELLAALTAAKAEQVKFDAAMRQVNMEEETTRTLTITDQKARKLALTKEYLSHNNGASSSGGTKPSKETVNFQSDLVMERLTSSFIELSNRLDGQSPSTSTPNSVSTPTETPVKTAPKVAPKNKRKNKKR